MTTGGRTATLPSRIYETKRRMNATSRRRNNSLLRNARQLLKSDLVRSLGYLIFICLIGYNCMPSRETHYEYMKVVQTATPITYTTKENHTSDATTPTEATKRHSCPTPNSKDPKYQESAQIQSEFFDIIEIFNQVGCPYHITAGTLLGFVRECRLWADIDFAIPLEWWKETDNAKALQSAMDQRGGYENRWPFGHFGTPGKPGHEQAWIKNGVSIDFFSTINTHQNYFVWTIWIEKKLYPCVVDRLDVEEFLWGNITIRAPTPFDSVLKSYYGNDWSQPMEVEWAWDQHPFTIGSCTRDPSKIQRLLEVGTVETRS